LYHPAESLTHNNSWINVYGMKKSKDDHAKELLSSQPLTLCADDIPIYRDIKSQKSKQELFLSELSKVCSLRCTVYRKKRPKELAA
jgi:hypothetical protein